MNLTEAELRYLKRILMVRAQLAQTVGDVYDNELCESIIKKLDNEKVTSK